MKTVTQHPLQVAAEFALSKGLPAEQFQALTAVLERARVVAVLDGWAERRGFTGSIVLDCDNEGATASRFRVAFHERRLQTRHFYGPTADAARAAAAKAIQAGEV